MGLDNSLKVGSNEMELVDFRIYKKEGDKVYEGIYGINVSKVREIIKVPKLTELPGTPDYIEGIFDLRDVVIPVVNLAKWMGIEEPEDARLTTGITTSLRSNIPSI
jgi:two-component system chemotaxis response regulator CheV